MNTEEQSPEWVCWVCDERYMGKNARNSHVEENHPTDLGILSWIQQGRP